MRRPRRAEENDMSVVANQTDRLESHIAAACGLNDDVGCCAASKRPHRLGYTRNRLETPPAPRL